VEFTPAQLIGAICTLLLFGLVCFVFGIVVNQFDSRLMASNEAVDQEQPPEKTAADSAGADTDTASEPASPSEQPAEARAGKSASVPAPPRHVHLPDEGEEALSKPSQPTRPQASKPDVSDPEPPEQPPAEESGPGEESNGSLPEPMPVEEDSAGAEDAKYAIQFAAYKQGDEERTTELRRQIEQDTGLETWLHTSPEGPWTRILGGRFQSREEAEQKKEELREQEAYKDCWVYKP